MKRETSISTQLGVTHEDMAMLLNVSRSLWTLFEAGKRSLPTPAQALLAEMLQHAKDNETKRPAPKAKKDHAPLLNKMLKENEYQQHKLKRKIAALEKKQIAQERLSALAGFMNNKKSASKGLNLGIQNVAGKAKLNAVDYGAVLFEEELRLELLGLERKMLESKLK